MQSQSRKRWLTAWLALGFCALGWHSGAQSAQPQTTPPPTGPWRLGRTPNEARYLGQAVCAQCHAELVKQQAKTAMAHALTATAQDELLLARAPLSFKLGAFTYRIERQGAQFSYSITNGEEQFSTPLLWSFGYVLT